MLRHAALALILLLVSIMIGMGGYEYFEALSWRSAFLNSAMLLGGMGPVDAPHTDGGINYSRGFMHYTQAWYYCSCWSYPCTTSASDYAQISLGSRSVSNIDS
jgi:hypothetical protein